MLFLKNQKEWKWMNEWINEWKYEDWRLIFETQEKQLFCKIILLIIVECFVLISLKARTTPACHGNEKQYRLAKCMTKSRVAAKSITV